MKEAGIDVLGYRHGGWGMFLMTVSNLLFWGLAIAGVVALVRYLVRVPSLGHQPDNRRARSNSSPSGSPAPTSTTRSFCGGCICWAMRH